ncbi:MAG: hypothetical protein GY948_01160 [Alphaproteobacteria bacterium]|nr:hypothetical protein [Alphaproteobacteria bacterium]
MITFATMVLALVTFQRLGELVWAQRNMRRLMKKGAREEAPGHYLLIVLLHAAWLLGLWWFAWDAPVNLFWLAVFVVLQLLRLWVLATLGERWTTKIVVLPGAERITSGPFKFLNHPNYAVVIGEIAVLPLTFGLWLFAIIFSLLNAAVLFIRIRAENEALERASAEASTREDDHKP